MNKIINRMTIAGLLIVVQVTWFAILFLRVIEHAIWIQLLLTILSAIVALYVVHKDDNPAYKIGWIVFVCIAPLLGAPMYFMFGNKRTSKKLKRKIEAQEKEHIESLLQRESIEDKTESRMAGTVNYVSKHGPYPAWTGTTTKYYPLGDNAFPDLVDDLKKAEKFIFMEYFIIEEGKMWNEIFDVLKEKIEEGVEVRLLYDDVGCMGKIPANFASKVRQAGIKIRAFNPVTPIVSLIYNNRDHRKMTIIDGRIAHSGGYNLADEYINQVERFGHWKDSGIRLEGRAAWNYTVMFLNMWNSFNDSDEDYKQFVPEICHAYDFDDDGIVQPYSDSPLDEENIGENVYIDIINQAEKYVYIFTPYLVIDNEMKTALCLAAKRGVDVRIVTPGIPDKKMVYRLTRSYYEPLIKSGVRVYEYEPGFIHAKSYVSDDKIGVVGTINMDYRSLYLHFECGTLLINCSALKELKKDCLETFEISREIGEEQCKRTFFGMILDAMLRVAAPLL